MERRPKLSKRPAFEQRSTTKCLRNRERNIMLLQWNSAKSGVFQYLIVCSDRCFECCCSRGICQIAGKCHHFFWCCIKKWDWASSWSVSARKLKVKEHHLGSPLHFFFSLFICLYMLKGLLDQQNITRIFLIILWLEAFSLTCMWDALISLIKAKDLLGFFSSLT